LNNFLIVNGASHSASCIRFQKGVTEEIVAILLRPAFDCDYADSVALAEPQVAELGVTDAEGIFKDSFEYWVQLTG
jgi:hypothetical protein